MMGIGPLELLLILVIALVVVGPKKLPEMGRQAGKMLRDLRRMQDEVKDTIRFDLDDDDDEPPTTRTRSSDRSSAHEQRSRTARTSTVDTDEDEDDPDEDDLPTERPVSGSAHARAAAREREANAREAASDTVDPSTNGHGTSGGDPAADPDEAG